MSYYDFTEYFLYNDTYIQDCPPPYDNFTNPNCFDTSIFDETIPELFKCYTGILIYCPNSTLDI